LAHLGLLYLFTGPGGKGYYVPTPLTAGLSGGGEKDGEGGDDATDGGAGKQTSTSDAIHDVGDAGHIIVETNYRVYAYTFSDVECEILRLFTRPDYRLPNLYVGMLTREAVHDALDTGKFIFILVWAIRLTACFVHRRRRGADNQIPPSARAPKLASRHEGRRDSPERRGPDHAVGVGA
jgi:transcription initiation factor TFIIH subunit 4